MRKEGVPSETSTEYSISGSRWSVGEMFDSGAVSSFHPTPWEFSDVAIFARTHWSGGYKRVGTNTYLCEIVGAGGGEVMDTFTVVILTPTTFVATKAGKLYRFGKKL